MATLATGSARSRRDFLRLAAGGAALLAAGAACDSGPDSSSSQAAKDRTASGARGQPTLRIAQWNNYVAGYDQWWDEEYTQRWGERNGVDVVVDHFDINQTSPHAEAEVASQRGHDLVHMIFVAPAAFEDHVIDHREVVEEIEAKAGPMIPFVQRAVFNPRTKKYLGVSDYWTPNPVHYRADLWGSIRPVTWDDVLAGGSRLKAGGHPVGIGMGLELESNVTLLGLLHAFGASIQDEGANVAIQTPATVEAVKFGTALFRSAMTDEMLNWDIASNNRFLISGRGSLILNAIAAIRALEAQDPALAAKVQLLPFPEGPGGKVSPYVIGTYVIWKFSENQEAAKQFLVDLALNYRDALLHSRYMQLPSFPGALAGVRELLANDANAQPPDKYRLMADAERWSTNVGHPGHTNAAHDEVIRASIISQMFAAAARGEMTAEDSVRAAEARIKPIFDKWREQGKI